MRRAHRMALGIVVPAIAVVAARPASTLAAPPPDAPAPSSSRIGAALPTVADFPGSGLKLRTAQALAPSARRAPYPCTDYRARAMRGTDRWAEWKARGGGRSVRVITFAYPASNAGATWRSLRSAIDACPRIGAMRQDDGSRGTATLSIRSSSRDAIGMEIVTRSASGSSPWGKDRVMVYRRVGSAIQKVQVSRGILTPGDRALLQRVARVSRAR